MQDRLLFRARNVRERLNGSAARGVSEAADAMRDAATTIQYLTDEVRELRVKVEGSALGKYRREMAKVQKLIIASHSMLVGHQPTATIAEKVYAAREAIAAMMGDRDDA